MGSPQNCPAIQAILCPGYSGTSPLWVSKSLLPGSLLGSGGSFAYDGACYSIPANAQPQMPTGGGYANAGYMGGTFQNCATCCAAEVHPAYLSFCPPSGGSYKVQIQYGPPNAAFTASASSTGNWLSVSPTSGKLDSSGSVTLTVTAKPITNPPQEGTVQINVAGCPEPLIVVADDSNPPATCPSGLPATLRLGGGPISASSYGAVQTCAGLTPPPCGNTPVTVLNWDGEFALTGEPCGWNAAMVSNSEGGKVAICWEGYVISSGCAGYRPPYSYEIGSVASMGFYGGGGWKLVFPLVAPAGLAYIKPCGSSPRGVYTNAAGQDAVPQTLYVE